jgi:hypothetical protein
MLHLSIVSSGAWLFFLQFSVAKFKGFVYFQYFNVSFHPTFSKPKFSCIGKFPSHWGSVFRRDLSICISAYKFIGPDWNKLQTYNTSKRYNRMEIKTTVSFTPSHPTSSMATTSQSNVSQLEVAACLVYFLSILLKSLGKLRNISQYKRSLGWIRTLHF